MKKRTYLFFIIISFILFACEAPIYHNFELENKTDSFIIVHSSLENSDSIISLYILPDSSMIIYKTDEMQSFFTGKVQANSIKDVFKRIEIQKDSLYSNINYFEDFLWSVEYEPGTYTYKLVVKNKDFE